MIFLNGLWAAIRFGLHNVLSFNRSILCEKNPVETLKVHCLLLFVSFTAYNFCKLLFTVEGSLFVIFCYFF